MIECNEKWLCNFVDNEKQNDESTPLSIIWAGGFVTISNNPLFNEAFQHMAKNTFFDSETINIELILGIAISSLNAFVEENFLGSNVDKTKTNELLNNIINSLPLNIDLSSDGEPINANVKHPELLALAEYLFCQLLDRNSDNLILQCWMIRCLYIHQKILEAPANSIYEKFLNQTENILKSLENAENISTSSKATIVLEICQGFLVYKRVGHGKMNLDRVRDLLKTDIKIEGVLGKRTKYQQKALPQMLLRIQTELDFKVASETHKNTILPQLLQLNDDVRLERIEFETEEDNQIFALPSIVQLLVLAEIKYIQISQPKDKLADEEIQPYLTTLLHQETGPWACRIATLLDNIHLEENHKRTVDRSLKQCEDVFRLIDKGTDNSFQRFSFAYASYMKPKWEIQVQFGRLMISLGLIKSALDLYLGIQKWNEVIICYTLLDLKHKAAEVIEQELEKRPTVELYCLLGNAKNDTSFYEKAWELSNHRSGRAQRDWGFHYFAKREYKTAIEHLQKAVEINSLQEDVWSRLGYAAICLEDWSLAVMAYKRYTYIEPHGFESWNNLAKAYIQLGEKNKAHKVLQEALKCNFNNWKVWENFLLVSTDTGNFEDVINAYDRLIELKGKYYDYEVLKILVYSIVGNIKDAEGRSSERLHKKLQTLVSHLCVLLPQDGPLWELAAQLSAKEPLSQARKLQKAYQCFTQTQSSWSKNPDTAHKVLQIGLSLCQASIAASEQRQDTEKQATLSQLSSARLSAQACIRAVSTEKWDNCTESIKELENLLNQIKDLLLQNK